MFVVDQSNAYHGGGLRGRLESVPRPVRLAALVPLVLAMALLLLRPASPGDVIRSDLQRAASETSREIWPVPSPAILAAVQRDFQGLDVSVEAIRSTQIAVTLHGLDRQTCIDAVSKVQRIEGPAVVTLDGYGSPDRCRDRNDMSWRIMP